MNRRITGVFGGLAAFALVATAVPGSAQAAPPADPAHKKQTVKKDDRPDKLEQERRELRKEAIAKVVSGDAKVEQRGGSKSVRVAPGQWVEYETEATDQLLSFLVEFGGEGPQKGEIPAPGAKDNSTYWTPSFDRKHYEDMFFNGMPEQNGESFKSIYKEMSSGRYDVEGDVSDWVKINRPESDYGTDESHEDMTEFIDDTAEAWYAEQRKTKTPEQVEAYLKTFDEWDRFDQDGDGNFDEPDGYIDHFQAIHAGEGEEAGAPESAIWSHRWAVNQNGYYKVGQPGQVGPQGYNPAGGIKIGDTNLWIRDYTTEPENGGLGVFAHEYGHDLGLPDFYDTKGGENSTAFWTLMSSGSWMSHAKNPIGTTPNHMGPWEKLQLGWLDYDTVEPGESKEIKLGPSYHATKSAQAALVKLPTGHGRQKAPVAADAGNYLFSGTNDDKVTTATSPEFTVPAAGQLAARVNYNTEKSFDYSYVELSVDGGKTFTPVHTSLSDPDDPNAVNEGEGISGNSRGWKSLTADLSAFAGQKAQLRFRQTNDENTHGFGFAADTVTVGAALVEDFEDEAPDWTKDGFSVVSGGTYPVTFEHFYLAENRQYMGYDRTLAEGPYNFGWGTTAPDRVEKFPYQNGLLVWYSNGLYSDNNTSEHPGGGEALPVDARAKALKWSDGTVARNRIQAFDATFGLSKTDAISLHREVAAAMTTLNVGSQPAIRTFDDTNPDRYWDAANPGGSTKVGGTGTKITVVNQNDKKGQMTIQVN